MTTRALSAILDGPPPPATLAQTKAALMLTITTAEAIRTAGEIPSGHLYAK